MKILLPLLFACCYADLALAEVYSTSGESHSWCFATVDTSAFESTNEKSKAAPSISKPLDSKSRTFEFEYGATIEGVKEGSKVRVWLPIARSDQHQTVNVLSKTFPSVVRKTEDAKFGNGIYYFELESEGDSGIAFNVTYDVERFEVVGLTRSENADQDLSKEQAELFLQASSKVPTTGKSVELYEEFLKKEFAKTNPGIQPEMPERRFYDWVNDHMQYDKSQPGYGNGDVLWACDSKTGNCTDFHSMFISVARNQKTPAKFEIGFPLPTERGEGSIGGYHCWAKFYSVAHGWVPVDISEADKHPDLQDYYFGNLTENRFHFSTGRDIVLEPKQDSEPLNYFVYPHVEVDGKVWPQDKIKLNFGYKDN